LKSDYKVSFFVSGQGRLFQLAVKHASQLGINPELLFLDEKADSSLEEFAFKNDITCVRSYFANKDIFYNDMKEACLSNPARLLMLTFDKIVPEDVINSFQDGAINLHLSLLPAFKGFSAVKNAIKNGNKFIGATMHFASSKADDGAIIAQTIMPLDPKDSEEVAQSKLGPNIIKMYLQVIHWLREGRIEKISDRVINIKDAKYDFSSVVPNIEKTIESLKD
jgi:phosphoribosylglycinamide formyltransferase-1